MKKKSASQTAQKLSKKVILLTIAALALCALPAVALAELCIPTTTWTGASGSWFIATNWSNGVPDSGKSAYINNGRTADVNSTGAVACNLTLGYDAVESGKVSVAGGSLAVTNEVEVGAFGKGTLIVTNGGTVSAGLLTIAALHGTSDSVGTVTVDGGTFTINRRADVGGDNGTPGGIGLVTVKNGGRVTSTAGNVRVYGSGTLTGNGTVSTTNGTTIDGTLSPSGTLTIGGDLSFGPFATMRCNVTSSSWDRVEVLGRATLNGRLSVTLTGFFTGDFPLLHASTLVGTFSSFSATYTGCLAPSVVYDYDNGYVYLHVESTCQ